MELQPFLNALHVVQSRATLLSAQVNQTAPNDALLANAVEDLQLALETLQVAEEEMRQQHEELVLMGTAVAEERQRYQDLYDFAPDAYLVTTPTGVIHEANHAATQLLQVPVSYLIGKPLPIFVTPADQRQFRRHLLALARTPTPYPQRWELGLRPRHSPEVVPVEVMVVSVTQGQGQVGALQWMLRDITDRKQLEDQLHATNAMLGELITASPLPMIALDSSMCVTLWNPSAEVLFGWRAAEVIGKPLPNVRPEDQESFRQGHERTMRGDHIYEMPVTRVRRDGSLAKVSLSAAPLRQADGTITGSVGVLVDITERAQLRADLAHTQRQLAESREVERRHLARELHDEVVQQLLGLSYQLAEQRRNVTVGLLSNDERVAQLRHALHNVQDEVVAVVKTLRGLINDLRPAGLEEFGVCITLEGFLSQLRSDMGPAGPELTTDLERLGPELPLPTALCVFRVAQEAIRNVLRHAHATKLAVRLYLEDRCVILEVEDNGRGFALPTRWSELTREGHFGLVGLRERAELAGGAVTIRSEPGKGTWIKLTVPVTPQEEDDET